MLKKSGVLAAVLKANLKPSNEDSVVTEEVGKTADAVVEIERLKQENLDLMEIHALEQDLALIEQDGDAIGELSEATDEITELRAEIESYYEKGGMSASDAHHISKRLGYINKRLGYGLNINLPATESFRGNDADRMTLTASIEASIGEKITELWTAFVNMIKNAFNRIKEFFGIGAKKAKEAAEKLDKAAEENKNKEGTGTVEVDVNTATAGGADEKKETAGKEVIDGILKIVDNTKSYIKAVDYEVFVNTAADIADYAEGKLKDDNALLADYGAPNKRELIGKIATSYTGKSLDGDLGEVKSDTLFGGYQITMKSEKVEGTRLPKITSSVDQIVKDSDVKKIKIEGVEFKRYADVANELSAVMKQADQSYSSLGAALDEYTKDIDGLQKKATGDNAQKALMYARWASGLVQNHPAKTYVTKVLSAAIAFASAMREEPTAE